MRGKKHQFVLGRWYLIIPLSLQEWASFQQNRGEIATKIHVVQLYFFFF